MRIHVSSSEGDWLLKLAVLLKFSTDGDMIIVSNEAMLDLAINAAKRMGRWPMVRIMDEQTWRKLDDNGNEA